MDWRNLLTTSRNPYGTADTVGQPDWRFIGAVALIVLGAVFVVAGFLGLLLGAGRYGFRGILLGILIAGGGGYLLLTNKPRPKAARVVEEGESENGAP